MSSGYQMTAPPEAYKVRRAKLAQTLARPIVIFAGHGQARNYPTNPLPFRPGSSYLYFGGPPIEHAAWLIEPGSDGQAGCILVRTPATLDDRVWMGESPSDSAIAEAAGVAVSSLVKPEDLAGYISGRSAGAIVPPCPQTIDWARELGLANASTEELQAIISLRLTKDEHELRAMREAAQVGMLAHRAAMEVTAPGKTEAQVVAAFMSVLHEHQCDPSFNPIVTVNGQVLHAHGYPGKLDAGRLLLLDGGAEESGCYASDISRTYPVTGKFSDRQRELYEVVLASQLAGVAACKAGTRFRDVHDLVARVITEGLVDVGLLKGNLDDLCKRRAHSLFFVHGVGHLIGLDVHDMEDFGDLAGYATGRSRRTHFGDSFLRLDRDLEPGMAVTIEPGIYFIPAIWEDRSLSGPFDDVVNRPVVEALLADNFGGIRIEDTICVGEAGAPPENLTGNLPKDVDSLEAIVSGSCGV